MLLALGSNSHAQLWSGILAPTRAVDWSSTSPGVVGGIPSGSWTQCGSTIAPYSGSATTINNAIANCAANHYVQLGAGIFALSSGIVLKSNMELRGMGPDQTFLIMTGNNACTGAPSASICAQDSLGLYYGSDWAVQPGSQNAATWTAGFGQGTTNITLTNVGTSGIINGQYIYLDQSNDDLDNGTLFICDNTSAPCSLEGGAPGRTMGGIHRNQIQFVKVVSGCSSTCSGAGPFNITISPGLYGTNWQASKNGQTAGAWWSGMIQNTGVQALSLDNTNNGGTSGISFVNAFNSWVKNVRSLNANRNHVYLWQSAHITVQDGYFFGTQNSASQSYGIESFIAGDNLVVNNIFQRVTAPIMMGPSQGSVFAYNYSINDTYYVAAWMQQSLAAGHDAGVLYNLFEGNEGSGFWADVFHGTGGANTTLRNRLAGWEAGKTEDTVPVQLYSYNRCENVIGNVLGTPGYHSTYQTSAGTGAAASIYDLGSGNSGGSVTVPSDSKVASTLMRWGNYDTVNASVQWNAPEVPSGLASYANPVPANHNVPASFYLASKPGWWSGLWPPIGPDVTGGNIAGLGGHAYLIPAANCYLNVLGGVANGTGAALTFNANGCYSVAAGPAPPTGLTAVVQ